MEQPLLEFHPKAVEEAQAARAWYEFHSPEAARAFVAELEGAVDRIREGPNRWPTFLHGTRRYLLRRFPYIVVYREASSVIQVVAVAHASRRPGYWKRR